MMYSEFAENTGCKDNEYNHKLFKRLEIIYMEDDSITKEEIYDMGRKLMDNSKTEEQIRLENEITCEIECYKEDITRHKTEINQYKALIAEETDKWFIRTWKDSIKWRRAEIKRLQLKINNLKWVLGE